MFREVSPGYFIADQSNEKIKMIAANLPSYNFRGVPAFFDVGGLSMNPEIFAIAIDVLYERYQHMNLTSICCVDARGFLFGPSLALKLNIPFFMARKAGKLPGIVLKTEYTTEYSTDTMTIPCNAVNHGDRVLIIDDLLATGGTGMAAATLISELGGVPVEVAVIIAIPTLRGWLKLLERNISVCAIVETQSTREMPAGSDESVEIKIGSDEHSAILKANRAYFQRGHVLCKADGTFTNMPLGVKNNTKYS